MRLNNDIILFLYIVPLKQGLKQTIQELLDESGYEFLYIVPLKQGLKLSECMKNGHIV